MGRRVGAEKADKKVARPPASGAGRPKTTPSRRRWRVVVMVRGVNVGGRRLAMSDFSALLTELGYEDVATYLQSGNAVCRAAKAPDVVAHEVGVALAERLGLEVVVVARSATELHELLDANPFLGVESDPAKLHVTFLADDPGPAGAALEVPAGAGHDTFVVRGRDVFLHCPGGYGRTKLTNGFFERRLGTSATTRNWRSVTSLVAMAADEAAGARSGRRA